MGREINKGRFVFINLPFAKNCYKTYEYIGRSPVCRLPLGVDAHAYIKVVRAPRKISIEISILSSPFFFQGNKVLHWIASVYKNLLDRFFGEAPH